MSEVNGPKPRAYRFGVFQLDVSARELYKHGIRIRLQDQPFQVLTVLLERPGEVVTREDLRQRIWGEDTYVDFDHSLNISVNKLREALGDSAASPRFIETLPRRGYRFIAPVTAESDEQTASAHSKPQDLANAPEPSDQSSASGSVRRDLWRPFALFLVAVVLVAGWMLWRKSRSEFATAAKHKVMLAVLPFQNLTGNPQEEFFVTGLHDEMIAQLGRMHPSQLGVIARASTAHYAETHKPLADIGRDLHADYVLDGSVRQVGERFRITASLIDVSNQTQLWTETYQPTMGDVLAMQESVARSVAHALTIEFLPQAAQEMQQQSKTNAAAYEAYLRGRFLWRQETFGSLQQAITQFQRAIDLDANYAPAYVGLADSYILLGTYGFVPVDSTIPKGKASAARALELSPNFSDAYNSLAFAAFYYDWDWNQSEILFRKALDLNPNNQIAHEFYSSYLHAMSRLDEADAQNAIAKELDPLSAWVYDDKGWILLSRRQPADAVAEFQRAIELNPRFPVAHLSLAVAYTRLGRFKEALAETNLAEEMGADQTRVLEVRGSAQALAGDQAAANATLEKLRMGKIIGRVSPYSVALIYTALGKKQEALDWLEKAVRDKDTWVVWIKVLVEWDPLRSEPRFNALLQQLKL